MLPQVTPSLPVIKCRYILQMDHRDNTCDRCGQRVACFCDVTVDTAGVPSYRDCFCILCVRAEESILFDEGYIVCQDKLDEIRLRHQTAYDQRSKTACVQQLTDALWDMWCAFERDGSPLDLGKTNPLAEVCLAHPILQEVKRVKLFEAKRAERAAANEQTCANIPFKTSVCG
jgi:hypothetical protein